MLKSQFLSKFDRSIQTELYLEWMLKCCASVVDKKTKKVWWILLEIPWRQQKLNHCFLKLWRHVAPNYDVL